MPKTIMLIVVALAGTLAHATPVTWEANGHCYEVRLRPDGIDWQTAQNESVADGGTLATITSAAENAFVFNLPGFSGTNGPWIGGSQPAGAPEPGGDWQWVTGEPFVYANWEVGKPNDGFGNFEEDAIHFFFLAPGPPLDTWNDIPRTTLPNAYVFEAESCPQVPMSSFTSRVTLGAALAIALLVLVGYAFRRGDSPSAS